MASVVTLAVATVLVVAKTAKEGSVLPQISKYFSYQRLVSHICGGKGSKYGIRHHTALV